MPGRTEEGEGDEEWSDPSDDAVKSGSATDASRGETEDLWTRQNGNPSLMTFSHSTLTSRRKDPVCCILDKIDAELAAMSGPQTQASTILGRTTPTFKLGTSPHPLLPKPSTTLQDSHSATKSTHGRTSGAHTECEEQRISGSAEIYTDAALTDDDFAYLQPATEDFLSDLDSVVAQQIDSRFKEIMLRKRVSPSPVPAIPPKPILPPPSSHQTTHTAPPPPPPPPPTALKPLSTVGYGTDNDSIKTEDFEHRFNTLLVLTDGNASGEISRKPRAKHTKSGNKHGVAGARKGGLGGGPATRSENGTSNGKVSFDDTWKDKDNEKSGNSLNTSPMSSLNRVLQHSMKSLGETTVKELVETSSGVSSLPPSGRSRSVSPERLFLSERPKALAISEQADMLDSASEEIERQSARIQREMERERRARSVSPARGMMTSHTALPPRPARAATPARLQTQTAVSSQPEYPSDSLTAANVGYHIENADKLILGQELKTLRGALFTTKLHLKEAEKDAKGMREDAEEARSELMLIDFKRATATKDLHRLLDDVERKRVMSHTYNTEVEAKRSELRGFESLGITKEEAKTLHEENASLKQRQRGMEVLRLERDECARQLDAAKDDLLREQKQARLQREELSEEFETLNARLEETQNGWAIAQQQVQKLELAFRRMEQEKNVLIQEQSKEYNAFKTMARHESKENRQLLSHEVDVLNKELTQLQVKVADLQADNKDKDESNLKLRQEILELTSEVAREQAARAAVTEDHRKTLHMLRKETDSAMLQLRESLFLDKQRALEELRGEIEQERRNSSFKTDERMAQMLAENAELISEKNQELSRLQEKMKDLQETQHSADRRLQEKLDIELREAVARERAAMEKETQWQIRNERENLARDTKQRINEMQMTLDHERESSQRLTREVAHLKEELEEQRRLSREAAKEKLVAVARAKDQIREQSSAELENVREKIKQEMQREVDRLQSQLKSTEEEIRVLRLENQKLTSKERDNWSSLDRTEKTVINEINEENRRSASILGVSPRQLHLSAVTDSASGRAQITAALANLRAVNEELRKHIQEMTSELDSCRAMITTMQKEQEESLENIRLEMEKKRTLELENIKEKLIREHTEELAKVAQASARQSLANSMVGALRHKDHEIADLKQSLATWRDQTSDKFARTFKNELAQELEKSQAILHHSTQEQKHINGVQQMEIARLEKEVRKLAMMQNNKATSPSPTPSTPQQQQQQYLQARIKQLHSENNALRRKHLLSKNNVSVPDLSTASMSLPISPRRCLSPGPGDKLRKLEERLRLGEKEALMAEERARLKQSTMTHKLVEMTKLQDTLTDQNQELMRLEHAYTQLHRQYNNSPSIAVSHILNNTR
ncbi:ELKS/Rab6-interacting/CAST family member 1-like [Littorina saxatilis]|uniref:Uncharacterized protein n=1 Tax=Littorina saxatilis TaxID=31220 RepID=A0AAN9AHP9_9CAEN